MFLLTKLLVVQLGNMFSLTVHKSLAPGRNGD